MNLLLQIYCIYFRNPAPEADIPLPPPFEDNDEDKSKPFETKAAKVLPRVVTCNKCQGTGILSLTTIGLCEHCYRLEKGFEYPDLTSFIREYRASLNADPSGSASSSFLLGKSYLVFQCGIIAFATYVFYLRNPEYAAVVFGM